MTLLDIIKNFEKFIVTERRHIDEDYCEFVFPSQYQKDWQVACLEILGPAIKPAGEKPSLELTNLTSDLGYIRENQTLFKKTFEKFSIIAIFMPWDTENYVTLKLAIINKKK